MKIIKKKGSLQDLILVGTVLLFFSVVMLIGFKISNELNNQFQSSPDIPDAGKTASNQINDMYSGVIDNSFLFLTVGISLIALVLAMLVRIHPIFFIFYLLILVVVIFLCGVFSNIYLEIANNPEMSALAEQLTFTTNIMAILPFFVGIFGFILSIIMYKTWQGVQ